MHCYPPLFAAPWESAEWTLCGTQDRGGYSSGPCKESICDAAAGTCEFEKTECTAACNQCDLRGVRDVDKCIGAGEYDATYGTCRQCAPELNFNDYTQSCACDDACVNGGFCAPPENADERAAAHAGGGFCKCPSGFTGKYCEQGRCEQECQNGGICLTGKKKQKKN